MDQGAPDRKENNQFSKLQLMSNGRYGSSYQTLTYLFTYAIDKIIVRQ